MQRTADLGRGIEGAVRRGEATAHDALARLGDNRASLDRLDERFGDIEQSSVEFEASLQTVEHIRQRALVIQRIAEECRMLSLNASIEAARAGEAGRGFSVVAESMRDLANKSRATAGEIDGLVKAAIEKVRETSATTNQRIRSGRAELEVCLGHVDAMGDALDEVAGRSQEALEMAVEQQQVSEAVCAELQSTAEHNSHETGELLGLLEGIAIAEWSPERASKEGAVMTIIDVRTEREWNDELGHLETAQNHPIGDRLEEHLRALPRDEPILFVCRSGGRSMRACRLAVQLGFETVVNLEGGMLAWNEASLPVVCQSRLVA